MDRLGLYHNDGSSSRTLSTSNNHLSKQQHHHQQAAGILLTSGEEGGYEGLVMLIFTFAPILLGLFYWFCIRDTPHLAAKRGDAKALEKILAKNPCGVDEREVESFSTPLHIAAAHGKTSRRRGGG